IFFASLCPCCFARLRPRPIVHRVRAGARRARGGCESAVPSQGARSLCHGPARETLIGALPPRALLLLCQPAPCSLPVVNPGCPPSDCRSGLPLAFFPSVLPSPSIALRQMFFRAL